MSNKTGDNKTTRFGLFRSEVVLGVALVVIVNIALALTRPLAKADPQSLPAARTYVWWSTKEFQKLTKAPDVVLTGSSAVYLPTTMLDADYLNKDIDYVSHHRSQYLEDALKGKLGLSDPLCYNFGLPGDVMSDHYMIVRTLLKGDRQPKVLVLALTMRDFMDNSLRCAGGTPVFRYLEHYGDVDDLMDLARPLPNQRFESAMGKVFYLWAKRLDMQVLLSETAKPLLAVLYKQMPVCLLAEVDPQRNMPGNLRDEVEPGMMIAQPGDPVPFEDNSAQMRRRYRTKNDGTYEIQTLFLGKLMDLAKERGLRVLIVNVPLPAANHKLMVPGCYDRYMALLRNTVKRYGCDYINLDGDPQFVMSDYRDYVHMNGRGGKKMIDAVVNAFTCDSQMAASLQESGAQTASQGGAY